MRQVFCKSYFTPGALEGLSQAVFVDWLEKVVDKLEVKTLGRVVRVGRYRDDGPRKRVRSEQVEAKFIT